MHFDTLKKMLEQNHPLAFDQAEMTYTDEYEILLTEHQKHHSLYDETPNYVLILQNAAGLLQKGSGHFLVIVSLCNSMTQLYQWPGLVESIDFLIKILNQHWQQLYPALDRIKGRTQMLEWLLQRWERFFATHPINLLKLELLDELINAFNTLNQSLSEKLNNTISLFGLIRPLQEQQNKLKLEQSSRIAKQKAEREAAQLREQQKIIRTLEANAEVITHEDYLDNLDTHSLFAIARERRFKDNLILMQQNPLEPSFYLFSRINTWFAYPCTWQEVENQITAYEFDEAAYFAALKLFYTQQYADALIAYETLFYRYPYYLDFQYYIIECMTQINPEANFLISVITDLVQKLVVLYPELKTAVLPNQFRVCGKETMQRFAISADAYI